MFVYFFSLSETKDAIHQTGAPDRLRAAGGALQLLGGRGGQGGAHLHDGEVRAGGGGRGQVELQTKVREDFTITEKAPTRAFSWLKE